MSDHCRICDKDFSAASYGGPGICPACDCGHNPTMQADYNRGFRAGAAAATARLLPVLVECGEFFDKYPMQGTREFRARLRQAIEASK